MRISNPVALPKVTPTTVLRIVQPSGSPRSSGELDFEYTLFMANGEHIGLDGEASFDSKEDFIEPVSNMIDNWEAFLGRVADFDGLKLSPLMQHADLRKFPLERERYSQEEVDLSAIVAEACVGLAEDGQHLFEHLFGTPGDVEGGFADALASALNEKHQRFKITSNTEHFRIPWGLLYSAAISTAATDVCAPHDETVACWKNFWGARHAVTYNERLPRKDVIPPTRLDVTAQPDGGCAVVKTNVFADRTVEQPYCTFVADEMIDTMTASAHVERIDALDNYANSNYWSKADLVSELADSGSMGKVAYFFCHGSSGVGSTGTRGEVRLTDGPVTPSDISKALKKTGLKKLADEPIIFFNACDSAKMFVGVVGRGTIGSKMLKLGARGVVGPACRVPIVFAGAFAEEFLDKWAGHLSPAKAGCEEFITLAEALAATTTHFIEEKGNPLGLLYSAYQVGDQFLHEG